MDLEESYYHNERADRTSSDVISEALRSMIAFPAFILR
jgi:hypothetical protein